MSDNSQWDGPKVPRSQESANEHYSPREQPQARPLRRDAAMRKFVEHPPAWAMRLTVQEATEAFLTGWNAAEDSR